MAKVNKTYSLDPEVFMMLERYCSASDTWGKKKSRSKVVNEAIRWYISGDTADLVDSQEKLMAKVRELAMRSEKEDTASMPKTRSMTWWRRLLGLN
jgi:hypothetical protein